MSEQIGWRGLVSRMQKEAPSWAIIFPQFPRLLHHMMAENRNLGLEEKMQSLIKEEKRQNRLLIMIVLLLMMMLLWQVLQ
jgi:ubiquinone biosynthesis protein